MWRAITEEDVHDLMQEREVEVFTGEKLVPGQDNPLAGILARVTQEFRGNIRSCERNELSEDETLLPEAVIGHAAVIARNRLMQRFDDYGLSEDRTREGKDAFQYFMGLARCTPTVESPTGRDSQRSERPGVTFIPGAGAERTATRESLQGL